MVLYRAILCVVGAIIIWRCYQRYKSLLKNIEAAKRSSIPYIVVPLYGFNRAWLTTWRLFMPLLRPFPKSWKEPWIDYLQPEFYWQHQYSAWERMGSDVFLLVSPSKITMFVADADVVNQIVTRRNDFPKPISLYGALDVYGKNVVTTEASNWRHHRRITAPPFNESSNQLVWRESLAQAQSMLNGWLSRDLMTIPNIAIDTMRLSLHVISKAGFGVSLTWPHEDEGQAARVPENHTMTYRDALGTLLENLIAVLLIPKTVLAYAPMKKLRRAHEAYVEWQKYMRELYDAKRNEMEKGDMKGSADLMGALVSEAGATSDDVTNQESKKKTGSQMLSDTEVMGNAFVFILAGHETTANTIHFALLHLALSPTTQARVQEDIVRILGDRSCEEWNYESDLMNLFGSMVGAVMNETLRLIPPAIGIHKTTLKGQPQGLKFNNRQCLVPENTHIILAANAIHRNPRYWPTVNSGAISTDKDVDLNQFKPERWLNTKLDGSYEQPVNNTAQNMSDMDDFGGPQGRDTSAALFHPTKGAYIPFSEGARSCLGRRFAQVEIVAVLSRLLRHYSVELAVDAYATDEEIERMPRGGSQRHEVWQKAAHRAYDLLENGMESLITIQLRKGNVPVRFVPKGQERFNVNIA